MTKRPTLQTIADELGVSRTTVSNAYNRPGQLTEQLRNTILDTAAQLGYSGPDPTARRLRTGTSQTIGVIFTESVSAALYDPTAVVLMRGMAEACETTALSLLLLPGGAGGAELVRNAAVDGVIVYSVPEPSEAIDVARRRQLPMVTVDEPRFDEPGIGYVGIHDRQGARAAADHVHELGHEKITILCGPMVAGSGGFMSPSRSFAPRSRVLRDRLDGYRDAIEAHGAAWSDVRLYSADADTPAAARAAAAATLAMHDRPTAILATTDQLALAALSEAAHRSIEVPRELSVVGFDDVPRASVASPALTTVRQPLFEKGRLALRMLRDEALGQVMLPSELVVRDSTASVVVT